MCNMRCFVRWVVYWTRWALDEMVIGSIQMDQNRYWTRWALDDEMGIGPDGFRPCSCLLNQMAIGPGDFRPNGLDQMGLDEMGLDEMAIKQ